MCGGSYGIGPLSTSDQEGLLSVKMESRSDRGRRIIAIVVIYRG